MGSGRMNGTFGAYKPLIKTWPNSLCPMKRVEIIRIDKGGVGDWFIARFNKPRYLSGKKGVQATIDYGARKRKCHQHDVWGRW